MLENILALHPQGGGDDVELISYFISTNGAVDIVNPDNKVKSLPTRGFGGSTYFDALLYRLDPYVNRPLGLFGGDDYTFEVQFYVDNSGSTSIIMDALGTSPVYRFIKGPYNWRISRHGGTTETQVDDNTLNPGSLHILTLMKKGSDLYPYRNGEPLGPALKDVDIFGSDGHSMQIGKVTGLSANGLFVRGLRLYRGAKYEPGKKMTPDPFKFPLEAK